MKEIFKKDWESTQERFKAWWQGEDLVACVMAPREKPAIAVSAPPPPANPGEKWLDTAYRMADAEYAFANTLFAGESFPYFDPSIGPGNLAIMLGSRPDYKFNTVWFESCMSDPEACPPLAYDPESEGVKAQMAVIAAGLEKAKGRFLVGMPDLIENIDILASLRGTENFLLDLVVRPDFVKEKVSEINQVFFQAFDRIYPLIKDEKNGNASASFRIWGPGKTSKVQCDTAAMISPAMFAEFVVPALTEQCEWLDYSLFHLDGTQCIVQLDNLLAIESLDAIQWIPQSGRPQGGDPMWHAMYRRILEGGKSVQAVGVRPEEVVPLLDAVGPKGMFIMVGAKSERDAEDILKMIEPYRA
ncbi:MAG: hypothetical protein V1800_18945 [Candidatus Latescibacterota bacterium]